MCQGEKAGASLRSGLLLGYLHCGWQRCVLTTACCAMRTGQCVLGYACRVLPASQRSTTARCRAHPPSSASRVLEGSGRTKARLRALLCLVRRSRPPHPSVSCPSASARVSSAASQPAFVQLALEPTLLPHHRRLGRGRRPCKRAGAAALSARVDTQPEGKPQATCERRCLKTNVVVLWLPCPLSSWMRPRASGLAAIAA